MAKPGTIRRYGKQIAKPKGDRLFAELPQTPVRPRRTRQSIATGTYTTGAAEGEVDVIVEKLAKDLSAVIIHDENTPPPEDIPSDTEASPQPCSLPQTPRRRQPTQRTPQTRTAATTPPRSPSLSPSQQTRDEIDHHASEEAEEDEYEEEPTLRILSWSEVCPLGDRIVKIAEASYAEVYRVTNERGTSIIKVIRMESPIKPQTKQQQSARLVDELPHSEADLVGELKISQLLADIPGFVMYKERYIVQGKTSRQLLETHQAFQRKIKRKDPGRLQFYPSPSRYLDDTKFLVVELGDAGTALEDFDVVSSDQMFDIFLHCAIALARAEARVEFEHRDLHEGNLCIRRVGKAVPVEERDRSTFFGYSGLDITILDYGISRASIYTEDEDGNEAGEAIAYDMERDLSLFRSEHAPQCQVYRRMRSFLLRDDRECLPPSSHAIPYESGVDGPIDWKVHEPYTNVLWLAYLFEYMTSNFRGPKKELAVFRQTAKNLWHHLDPDAGPEVPGFESASDIVRYAVESEWVDEDQLMGGRDEIEKSILSVMGDARGDETDLSVRRSPRKQRPCD